MPRDDEADERDDRERHVQVEDLLDEALVGVERRVEEDQREAAPPIGSRAVERMASVARGSVSFVVPFRLRRRSGAADRHQSSSRKSKTA